MKRRFKLKNVHYTADETYSDDDDNQFVDDDAPLFHLRSFTANVNTVNSTTTPIVVTPTIFGKPIQMELDTGSDVSLISKSNPDLHSQNYKLESTNIRLKTYSGEQIRPLGKINVDVQINEQSATLDLLVVNQEGPTLFGHDWLTNLGH